MLPPERHFIAPELWNLVVDELIETWGWLLYNGVCDILSEKFPSIVSQLLQKALSMEQQ